jgi:hypothetical protein
MKGSIPMLGLQCNVSVGLPSHPWDLFRFVCGLRPHWLIAIRWTFLEVPARLAASRRYVAPVPGRRRLPRIVPFLCSQMSSHLLHFGNSAQDEIATSGCCRKRLQIADAFDPAAIFQRSAQYRKRKDSEKIFVFGTVFSYYLGDGGIN